jgi:hypothetical protein
MNESGRIETMVPVNAPGRIASSGMFYSMILLVISLPLSEFGMSAAQFLLFFFWLFEGADFTSGSKNNTVMAISQSVVNNVVRKFRKAGTNYLLLIFLLFYFIHVAGLFYTSDFSYGTKGPEGETSSSYISCFTGNFNCPEYKAAEYTAVVFYPGSHGRKLH